MTRVLLLLALAAALVWFLLNQNQKDSPLAFYDESGGGGSDSGTLGLGLDWIGGLATDVTDAIKNTVQSISAKPLATVVSVWADAIQRFEGFFPGSRAYRNNNPGNLEPPGKNPHFYQGQTGLDGPYAVFDSYASGRRALEMDVRIKLSRSASLTIYQVMEIFAPPSENPTQQYADYVASALGTTSNALVSQIVG